MIVIMIRAFQLLSHRTQILLLIHFAIANCQLRFQLLSHIFLCHVARILLLLLLLGVKSATFKHNPSLSIVLKVCSTNKQFA